MDPKSPTGPDVRVRTNTSQTPQVRKTKISKNDLKSRLYDKGLSSKAMPSIKRAFYDSAKQVNTSGAVQKELGPVKPSQGMSALNLDQFKDAQPSLVQSLPKNGMSRNLSQATLGGTEAKSRNPSNLLSPIGKQSATGGRDGLLSPQNQGNGKSLFTQTMYPISPNPQFSTFNTAPYQRPMSKLFGYKNQQFLQDPTKKTIKTSEEVTSITGISTMTALGPHHKKKQIIQAPEEIIQKRCKSNKGFRQNFVGNSDLDEKKKELMRMLEKYKEESPVRSPSYKQDQEDIFRSYHLVAKISGKVDPEAAQKRAFQKLDFEQEDNHYGSNALGLSGDAGMPNATYGDGDLFDDAPPKTNIDHHINFLQSQTDDSGEFIYLNPSTNNNPYDLEPIPDPQAKGAAAIIRAKDLKNEPKLNSEKFYTLSKKGLTLYLNDEPHEFISLTDWLIERNFHYKISQMQFFKQFKRWKILRMWRRNILQKKREDVSQYLQEKLFVLHDVFGPIILEHRKSVYEMEKQLKFLEFKQNEVKKLDQFANDQQNCRQKVQEVIQDVSEKCRKNFRDGMETILSELRKKINEQNEEEENFKNTYIGEGEGDKRSVPSDPVFEQLGFKHNLKYGPRSQLRKECSRFLRFSYLLDFVTLESLSNIYINSVVTLQQQLGKLNGNEVMMELKSQRNQFGEERRAVYEGPNPLFYLQVKFIEETIDEDSLKVIQKPQYVPKPAGKSVEEDFDPVIHLGLQEPDPEGGVEDDEDDEENKDDPEEEMLDKQVAPNLHKQWFRLVPSRNEFNNLLMEQFSEGMDCLRHFERWSRHEELVKYVKVLESWDDKVCDEWEPPDDPQLNCDEWLHENPIFSKQRLVVQEEIDFAFNRVEKFLHLIQPFLHQYWENKRINYQLIPDEHLRIPTDVIPLVIKRFITQKEDFEAFIPKSQNLGLLKLDVEDVKKSLTPNPNDCLDIVKQKLPPEIAKRANEVKDWLNARIKSLQGNIISVNDFVEQAKALEFIEKNFQGIKDRFDLASHIQRICVDNQIEFTKEEKKTIDEVTPLITQLNQCVMSAQEDADKNRDVIKKRVLGKIPKLNAKVEDFKNRILEEKFMNIDSNQFEMLRSLDELEAEMFKLVEKKKTLQDYQRTLDMEANFFQNVDEIQLECSIRCILWRSINEWKDLVHEWENSPFENIKVDEISKQAEKYQKNMVKCQNQLGIQSTAVQELKKMVLEFKETMPIVVALGNKKLEPRHWVMIKEILQVDLPLEDEEYLMKEFSLGKLIEINAAQFQEEIQNVSVTATQESNLLGQITELQTIWEVQAFKTSLHKEKYFILCELDEVQTALDDSLNNINTIIGSRYIKYHEVIAKEWHVKLNRLAETLEQWKECQRNWMYLENIFDSGDIKQDREKDYKEFLTVHTSFKSIMEKVEKNPICVQHVKTNDYLDAFTKNNAVMDKVQKHLNQYLEKKRSAFPRFYFVSNDELLQILADSSNVLNVEKHLNKCFDNIMSLILNPEDNSIINGMISAEKEHVQFSKSYKIKLGTPVEAWLGDVEKNMIETLTKLVSNGMKDYQQKLDEGEQGRKKWVMQHPGQVVAVNAQIQWTEGTEYYIQDEDSSLRDWLDVNVQQLGQLTELIRGDLDNVRRKILVALITTDVHARDIVEQLCDENVESISDFLWQQQLRYYIQDDLVKIKQVNACLDYGYEYMGATSRLVITPLTDRCWMTITGALHIKLGSAPAGPAGTGKTESTKDLAKALGIQCVVFNCSDQIEYTMMERLFSGLVQQGAWTCLDEFNRIDVEVLSVIAQQLLTIRLALIANAQTFTFGNVESMPLKPSCGVFITMNPGYAGRTELPDNLKVLFRPVSMMIPSYGLIAQIMLFAEGFTDATILSKKMVQLYKLSSEQLSQQDHYDFGMRAVKSVLVMAGSLKRANPTLSEDVVLIRAMRDSNIPKFLSKDIPLFQALIQDLFPGIVIPQVDYGELEEQIRESVVARDLQLQDSFILKVIQLFDTFNVRFGVMLVGPTGGGKSQCYRTLQHAMTTLRTVKESKDQRFQEVKCKVLNPKSISMGELYGEDDPDTKEWSDGLASKLMRKGTTDTTNRRIWTVFDGPVDAIWIENMNTVLDDNMMLCLANGERIKLRPEMRMLFEVQDLSVASPATVSRCGMVYMTPEDIGWVPYVDSWIKRRFHNVEDPVLEPQYVNLLREMFDMYVEESFAAIEPIRHLEPMKSYKIQMVTNLCNFLEYFLVPEQGFKKTEKDDILKKRIGIAFAFSFIWAFGGSFKTEAHRVLDNLFRGQFGKYAIGPTDTVFDYFIDLKNLKFTHWNQVVPTFDYDVNDPYFSILVPTVDTIRYQAVLDYLIMIKKPVFFTGETGVGKSVIIQKYLADNKEKKNLMPIFLNFSAQTSSPGIQKTIESKLDKIKGKKVLGASGNAKCLIFVDDVNMPSVEKYGAQPPIELLRQLLDQGGFYDRPKFFWKEIYQAVLICAAAPPSGGRSPLTPRFMRFFHLLCVPNPSEDRLKTIFEGIINGFLNKSGFSANVKSCGNTAVASTVDLFTRITEGLLPTPAKTHYTFNLRDISKVFQGILMCKPVSVQSPDVFAKLWVHEAARVFQDRLINNHDREFFAENIMDLLKARFKANFDQKEIFVDNPIIFSNLLKLETEDKNYEEINDKDKLLKTLYDVLYDFNLSDPNKMDLVFFSDAVIHICRISRVLLQPRGNALLIGVSGSGKQSLTKLGSFMQGYKYFSVKIRKNYKPQDFRNDIKPYMIQSGSLGQQNTFIMTDTQIVNEAFLEDINNLLNTGEITNLYEADEMEQIKSDIKPYMQQLKRPETNDIIYSTYIERLRDNFHIFMAMSPVGDSLRIRCRKFPSLVNCCTLDWFDSWPEEALVDVSRRFISKMDDISDEVKEQLAQMCMHIHVSVEKMSERFYDELRRRVYITPKSYLDGINLYGTFLEEKRDEYNTNINRLANGLHKLKATNEQVADLKIKLFELKPALEKQTQEAQDTSKVIALEAKGAEEKEKNVEAEAAIVNTKAEEIKVIKDEADAELAVAMPALKAAKDALNSLNKDDITEIKGFNNPSSAVQLVMKGVLILLKSDKYDWAAAKQKLGQMNFLDQLKTYDVNNIPAAILRKLKPVLADKEFVPEEVAKKSQAAKSLCLWAIAVSNYKEVYDKVTPKIEKSKELNAKFEEMQAALGEKKAQLKEVQDKVEALKSNFEGLQRQIAQLNDDIETTERRKDNAEKLLGLLAGEGTRWEETCKILRVEAHQLIGDVFIAAASIAYIGPFTGVFREELQQKWTQMSIERKIPASEVYSFVKTLGDPIKIRQWNLSGLPSDTVSTDNGIYATKTTRWPLMIDPQTQANRWIKKLEKEKLKMGKLTDGINFTRMIELSLRQGYPVLIEDIQEDIDPSLDPILSKAIVINDGLPTVNFCDKEIPYDQNFRLYITTKMANPHYLPEICIKLTIINFTVTFDGLEEQMLVDVVVQERPEVENQRSELVINLANFKTELQEIQIKILKMLSDSSEDTILDDTDLINTLQEAKEKSEIISVQIEEAVEIEKTINEVRNSYREVSVRGSILYFVIADLSGIDPMYQYSLEYVKKLFNDSIAGSVKNDDLAARIVILIDTITKNMYENICRGLFEAHKLTYSFLICTSIQRNSKFISQQHWNWLLKGAGIYDNSDQPENPLPNILSENQWNLAYIIEQRDEQFRGFTESFAKNAAAWEEFNLDDDPLQIPIPCGFNEIHPFAKLIVYKIFRPEKLLFAFSDYVAHQQGENYAISPPANIDALYNNSDRKTPIIFVLSQGADPTQQLIKFAESMGYLDRLKYTSLGQGQDIHATRLINEGKKQGQWVLLQNCHLYKSWMPELEKIVEKFGEEEDSINPDFRLYLTSMPVNYFPVSILQNGLKLTTEPPRGMKANLKRTFNEMSNEDFQDCKKFESWKILVFGLSFFHALVQERRKFGPLGWNIRYEFNDSDLETSIVQLRNFLDEQEEIPWDAMRYVTGQINYGGRVTDDWDRVLLMSTLKKFYNIDILTDKYKFSESGQYHVPEINSLQNIRDFIEQLPAKEEPEVFGMHPNANITYQNQESSKIVNTILEIQPRDTGSGGGGMSQDEIVMQLLEKLLEEHPAVLDQEECFKDLFKQNDQGLKHCLSTVLEQEMERFNRLLSKMSASLALLKKAIQGLEIMSSELDEMYFSFLVNKVPPNWEAVSYPSLKPLSSWIKDLYQRVEFMRNWLQNGHPSTYWLSGFFFPHGFMTGILQTFARKHSKAIDLLSFSFNVLTEMDYQQIEEAPEDGIYVYGLFLEGAKWDLELGQLQEQQKGEMMSSMPLIHFLPTENYIPEASEYICPCYKTSVRAGILSTTGQSTNFILPIYLPTEEAPEHWTLRGTALLTMLNE